MMEKRGFEFCYKFFKCSTPIRVIIFNAGFVHIGLCSYI